MQFKKGDIFQLFFLILIVFGVACIGLMFYKITHTFTTTVANTGVLNSAPLAVNANSTLGTQSRVVTDEMVFFIYLFGIIGIIISAARTNFSPTVVFLFIMMLLLAIGLSAGLTNIYQGIAHSDALSPEGGQLTLTNILLSKYTPLMMCVIGGVVLYILYGKSGSDIPL